MDYLKEKQYYIDRYDLITINQCLDWIDLCRKVYIDSAAAKESKDIPKAERAKTINYITGQFLFQIKADRYKEKEETIQKWINDDTEKQNKYDNTPVPQNIRCLDCKKIMFVKSKHLGISDDPLRMLFFFECSSCKKRRAIYEDGKEFDKKSLCPKCKSEIEVSVIKESKKEVIWKKICLSCKFSEIVVDDLEKMRAENEKFESERKEKEEKEKKLLEQCRENFCGEEKGKEAFEYIEASKVAKILYEEELAKYDSIAYQKVSRLKKISIVELEKMLNELIEKENYIKLTFDNPQIDQHVIIQFTLQDANSSRKEQESISILKKLIENFLEGTNWRLMSDGLSYRLGYLSGRLKGYEREEDFFELEGAEQKEESSKIDYETRLKYEGHSVVQLAKAAGEHKGIENVRKRRLEKEPEGFFLEDNEDFYQCGICWETTASAKTWWTLDGIRCADCQRNINMGVITAEIHKNHDLFIKDFQLTSEYDFNIHSSTVRKLRRQGLLNGRDLKREDGSVYYTVYLISENKEFLEKYPRKKRKGMIITDLLGEKLEL